MLIVGNMFTALFLERNWSLEKRGGYAIRLCLCMFRKGRPLSLWLHFGLHFGVILGAKFATILLFGRPGDPNRLTKKMHKTN